MATILGVAFKGEIPRAQIIDLETGETTPTKGPHFPTVAQSFEEAEQRKAASRDYESHKPQLVIIDVSPFAPMRRSSSPELAAEQKWMFDSAQTFKVEAQALAARVVADEVKELQVTHRDLGKAIRVELDKLPRLREDKGRAEQFFRNSEKITRDLFLAWGVAKTQLLDFPTTEERQEFQEKVDAAQLLWQQAMERQQQCSANVTAIESKLNAVNTKVGEAKASYNQLGSRIAQLEGKAPSKSSSLSYTESHGLR